MADNRIRWLVVSLALVVVAAAAWGYGQLRDANEYRNATENMRQQAFYNLLERVENMDVLLAKAVVSSEPANTTMALADIWRQATSAVEDLSALPLAHFELTGTAGFLAQLGDYSHSLAQQNARGSGISDKQLSELIELRTRLSNVRAKLQDVQQRAAKGTLSWVELAREANRRLPAQRPEPLDSDMAKMEQEVQQFPELVYDGPFSDHLVNREPLGLTGQDVSAEQASVAARRFLFGDQVDKYQLDYQGKTEGLIPAHTFSWEPGNEEGSTLIDVSVKGGHVIMLLRPRMPEKAEMSVDEAVDKGTEFLRDRNLPSVTPTYKLRQGNAAVISYVHTMDGILIYPDLLKVKVALDNGEVIGYEAMGFYMNNRERNLPTPKLTIDDAQARLNKQLKVVSRRAALIPLPNGQEVLTYEFQTELNGEDFLVYINAQTGEEEQILQIIHAPEGDLTQ